MNFAMRIFTQRALSFKKISTVSNFTLEFFFFFWICLAVGRNYYSKDLEIFILKIIIVCIDSPEASETQNYST